MRFYNIAKLKISIDGADSVTVLPDRMRAYECAPFDKADIAISFTETSEEPKPPEHELICRGRLQSYFKYSGGYGFYMGTDEFIANLVLADNDWSRIDVRILDMNDVYPDSTGQRLFYTLGYAMETAVLAKGRMTFHSSSIAVNGSGICFSAASGTGKSTHTALWLEKYPDAVMVNDDKPVIMREDGRILLCGTPWAGTTGINTNVIVPLKAVVCIKRGEENKIYPIDQITAIHRIIKESPKPYIPELMGEFMTRVGELVEGTDTYMLECTPDMRAQETAEREIFKACGL